MLFSSLASNWGVGKGVPSRTQAMGRRGYRGQKRRNRESPVKENIAREKHGPLLQLHSQELGL